MKFTRGQIKRLFYDLNPTQQVLLEILLDKAFEDPVESLAKTIKQEIVEIHNDKGLLMAVKHARERSREHRELPAALLDKSYYSDAVLSLSDAKSLVQKLVYGYDECPF